MKCYLQQTSFLGIVKCVIYFDKKPNAFLIPNVGIWKIK